MTEPRRQTNRRPSSISPARALLLLLAGALAAGAFATEALAADPPPTRPSAAPT